MYNAKHARRHRTFKQALRDAVLTYGVVVGSILSTATFAHATSTDLTPPDTSSVQCEVVHSVPGEPEFRKVVRYGNYGRVIFESYLMRQRRTTEAAVVECSDGTTQWTTLYGKWEDLNPVVWRPCASDGADPNYRCVWDARHMGNNMGRSFIVRKSGEVKNVLHVKAHRLWIYPFLDNAGRTS
jgi:hypothetical protein